MFECVCKLAALVTINEDWSKPPKFGETPVIGFSCIYLGMVLSAEFVGFDYDTKLVLLEAWLEPDPMLNLGITPSTLMSSREYPSGWPSLTRVSLAIVSLARVSLTRVSLEKVSLPKLSRAWVSRMMASLE